MDSMLYEPSSKEKLRIASDSEQFNKLVGLIAYACMRAGQPREEEPTARSNIIVRIALPVNFPLVP